VVPGGAGLALAEGEGVAVTATAPSAMTEKTSLVNCIVSVFGRGYD